MKKRTTKKCEELIIEALSTQEADYTSSSELIDYINHAGYGYVSRQYINLLITRLRIRYLIESQNKKGGGYILRGEKNNGQKNERA